MGNRVQYDVAGRGFMLAAGLMLAHQVAGKAVRDGLFLSRFAPTDLPKIVVAAAVVAILMGLGFARSLARSGPLRLVPAAFAIGSVAHLAEFALLQVAGDGVRAVVVVVIYLHLMGFGAILLSGFWSIVNEVLDPREARLRIGKIAGAGTIGGIVGGLLAERGAAWFGAESLLLVLAGLHLATALMLWRLPDTGEARTPKPEESHVWQDAQEAFRKAPFLVNLAVLVLLGTMSAALLDYLFKSGAAAAYGKGPALTRYFAIFYTANQILSFLVQSFLTPVALRRLGLGRTVLGHPAAVAVGAGASLFFPPMLMAPIARSFELVLRGSFLRSGYELFFTPVPPREKRAVKTFIDVGCDRMGDALGAGVLQLILLLSPLHAALPILLVTIAFAAIGIRITARMDAAYSGVLEHGLMSRAVALNEADVEDSTTLSALLRTTTIRVPVRGPVAKSSTPMPALVPRVHDPVLARLSDLRSGDTSRIQSALRTDQPFDATLAPHAIRLLAWDDAFDSARAFLLLHAHRAVGQLTDALLDPEQDFAVRRRIPHILAYTSSQRAVDGLMEALEDSRFEIRFNASRALDFLHRMTEALRFDSYALYAAVQRELSTSRSIWAERKLLDRRDQSDSQYWYLDEVVRDRADKSLEHVFSLLAVVLPVDPLKIAFRALHGDDRMLHGLALEYLENNLPGKIAVQLRALVEPNPASQPARPAQQVLRELMASHQSILMDVGSPATLCRS